MEQIIAFTEKVVGLSLSVLGGAVIILKVFYKPKNRNENNTSTIHIDVAKLIEGLEKRIEKLESENEKSDIKIQCLEDKIEALMNQLKEKDEIIKQLQSGSCINEA
jgi:peptidoglycan hydrolase CwlO-like protein